MNKNNKLLLGILFLFLLLLLTAAWWKANYLLVSSIAIIFAFIPLFIRFEAKKVEVRQLVLIAVLAALSAVGRIPFAAIPNVQPSTFIIIVSGLVFGAETGFMVGASTALLSNIFLGQGPWTPWQMFAWGLVGVAAGMLRPFLLHSKWRLMLFGLLSAYIYGWIMNVTVALAFFYPFDLKTIVTIYSASFLFDTFHAIANVCLLALFGTVWIKILQRYQIKYGLGSDSL